LLHVVRLHRDEVSLVGSIIQVALFNLVAESVWQVLQYPGWSEAELARIGTGSLARASLHFLLEGVSESPGGVGLDPPGAMAD